MDHLEVMRLFRRVGSICEFDYVDKVSSENNERRIRSSVDSFDARPGVYAWIEHREDGSVRVIYVGKAEVNVSDRQKQHTAGFKHSDRGRSHAEAIRAMIAAGSTIELHAYYPTTPVGEEEDRLLQAIKPFPIRNSAGKSKRAA